MTLDGIFQILIATVCILTMFGIILNLAGLMTWVERKLSAMIQDRIGPNRANIRIGKYNFTLIGLIHIMCDPVKLFTKEDFIPEGANKTLHTLAPIVGLIIPIAVFVVIPFAGPMTIQWKDIPAEEMWVLGHFLDNNVFILSDIASIFEGDKLHLSNYTVKFVGSDLDTGMLFIFGIASLAVYSVILAGWSSNNKFSFLGAVRGANQMISYEVALGLCAVGIFMIYGGVSLSTIVERQGDLLFGVIPKWGIVTQPLAALLFFACGMAEIKRVPFDLPEGESEIIAGYFTEYSSTKFTMFMFGEFVEMIFLAAVMTTLFLGGWQIPWVDAQGIEIGSFTLLWKDTALYSALGATGTGFLVSMLQMGKFMTALIVILYIIFTIRWTLPRFRYDQLMKLGWKMVLPLALINILVTGVVLVFTRGML